LLAQVLIDLFFEGPDVEDRLSVHGQVSFPTVSKSAFRILKIDSPSQ
jgi:hypothetical protein